MEAGCNERVRTIRTEQNLDENMNGKKEREKRNKYKGKRRKEKRRREGEIVVLLDFVVYPFMVKCLVGFSSLTTMFKLRYMEDSENICTPVFYLYTLFF